MKEERDERLWRTAKARAAFRRNLFAFLVINLFFWAIWWFNSWKDYSSDFRGIPWPIWITLGWGLGLAFHYFRAYHGTKADMAEEEYKKLKEQKS